MQQIFLGCSFLACLAVAAAGFYLYARRKQKVRLSKLRPGSGSSTPTRSLPILIAEASSDTRDLLATYLDGTDYHPHFALSGVEAVETYKRGHFVTVLMAVQLPDLDGIAALGIIREWECAYALPKTPVITITSKATSRSYEAGSIEMGASAHLREPLSRNKVLTALNLGRNEFENPSTSESQGSPLPPQEALALVPDYVAARMRDVESLRKYLHASDAFGIRQVARNLLDHGAPSGFARLSQVGYTLNYAAQHADWTLVADVVRDLEFYMENISNLVQGVASLPIIRLSGDA